jgi:hypothetical protein
MEEHDNDCEGCMQTVATVPAFIDLARKLWGAERRTHEQLFDRELAQIQEMVDFNRASPELRVHLADTILRESTPGCGAYAENGDARWFLHGAGRQMNSEKGSFDGRRVPVIRAALMLLAHAHFGAFDPPETREQYGDLNLILGMGGAALAATYLLSQLEYLFRVKGTYLDQEGKIQQLIPASLPELRGLQVGKRINQIQHAFALYLHGNTDLLALRLAQLDQAIKVGDRLKHIRPSAMHGTLADASAEGLFYGLLVSMFYFSEP